MKIINGDAIRDARRAAGLTQRDLANRVGRSQQQISYVESHEDAVCSGELADKLIKVLGVSPTIFVKAPDARLVKRRRRKPPAHASAA